FLLPLAAFLLGSLERSHREHAETLRERADQLERERIADAARAAAEERACGTACRPPSRRTRQV
ncbi:MAG TPA: hypothetical protein VGD71_32145, partial [Kribbella sp.]